MLCAMKVCGGLSQTKLVKDLRNVTGTVVMCLLRRVSNSVLFCRLN